MFAPTHNTRLLICRLGFLGLCLLPTAGILLWAGWLRTAAYRESWRARLADGLRVQVALSGVTHPRPGSLRFKQLDLRDPETGRPLLKIVQLDAEWRGSLQVLVADRLELTDEGLPWLWLAVDDMLRHHPPGNARQVRLFVSAVDVRGEHRADRLTEVLAKVEPAPAGPRAAVSFRVDGSALPSPALLTVDRNRQVDPPTTAIQLDTRDAPLPVRLAGPLLPWTNRLGPRTTFRGSLAASRLAAGWQGELRGELKEVELEGALTQVLPHAISGPAELHVEQARVSNGRLSSIVGSIHAGPGFVDRALLESASQALQLPLIRFAESDPQRLPYSELVFSFSVDSAGVTLRGLCSGNSPGVVLCDDAQPLLYQPTARQPVGGLVQWIEPTSPSGTAPQRTARQLLPSLPER